MIKVGSDLRSMLMMRCGYLWTLVICKLEVDYLTKDVLLCISGWSKMAYSYGRKSAKHVETETCFIIPFKCLLFYEKIFK